LTGYDTEEGRRLAARWQIERTRRPAGPDLVWLGYAKPEVTSFACAACGDAGFKQAVVRAAGRTFHICAGCGTHQAHPRGTGEAPPGGLARRVAIEQAAPIHDAARTAARAVAGLEGGRLLDLGCRLGFVVDVVRALPGWQAGGVDPGPLAALGAAALGAPIRQGGAPEAAGNGAVPAHVVLCEGVLERSADPLALLRALPALSVPRPTWMLATPDAAAIYDTDDAGAVLDLLRPERQTMFSAPGLRTLLLRTTNVDLATAPVERAGGMLRITVGARPGPPPDAPAILSTYLASRLAAPVTDPSFDIALRVAALEHAVTQARRGAARALLDGMAAALHASVAAARRRAACASLDTLFDSAPLCAGDLLLQAGLARLLDDGSDAQARDHLELAAGLCQRAVTLAPTSMRAQADIAERARRALAARAPGRAAAA
jgi:hypothetical protein